MNRAAKRSTEPAKSTTVRISGTSHKTLKSLAAQTGEPVQIVLDRAIEAYRRQQFFDAMNAAYTMLKGDPAAWQEELQERAVWDGTLSDDLDDE